MAELNFSPLTTERQRELLAEHVPDGYAWEQKNNPDSNIGSLMNAYGESFYTAFATIDEASREIDIDQTVQLIGDWEESVGIPDECFANDQSLLTRREGVKFKLTNLGGIQTAEDMEGIITAFGFEGTVTPAHINGVFAMQFPIQFFDSKKTADHTINVDLEARREVFVLPFPLPFTSSITGVVECVLEKVKAANTQLIFRYGIE